MADGEVLHKQVKEHHTDYIHFYLFTLLLLVAGESTQRSLNQSTNDELIDLQKSTLKNINLNIEQKTIRKFAALQNKVNSLSSENDKVVAMPFIPYLYFILNRKNPTPWIGLDYAELGGEIGI